MKRKISRIEISFVEPVDMTQEDIKALFAVVSAMTDRHNADHPGRVNWAFGAGLRLLTDIYSMKDYDPLRADRNCFSVECSKSARE